MCVRITTFNMNGIRSFSKYVVKTHKVSFNDFLGTVLGTDILCVQETRGSASTISEFGHLRDYAMFSAHNVRRCGYSGVSTFVRKQLYCRGGGEVLRKGEGRALLTDHGTFSVLNLYFPYLDNCKENCEEKKAEILRFYEEVGEYVKGKENLILCGDFNAVCEIRDHYQFVNEYAKIRKGGICRPRVERPFPKPTELPYEFFDVSDLEIFLVELPQRRWLKNFLDQGTHVDSLRVHNKEGAIYTCWNTFLRLRPRNLGTRIDLVLVPREFKVLRSNAMPEIGGSDHCPSYADVDLEIIDGNDNVLRRKNNIFAFLEG